MTVALWMQLVIALIQGLTQLSKDPDVPKDINDAKTRLHALVEALQL